MSNFRFSSAILLLFGFCTAISGCSDSKQTRDVAAETDIQVAASQPSENLVLVNNSPVTQAELELAIERTLGETAALYMNEDLSKKILDSLISSKAIAQKALAEMSVTEKQWLDLKAAAYKEELLVKYYLEKNVTPEPVTNEMVKNYYQENPDKFGGGTLKIFEYIQVTLPKSVSTADPDLSASLAKMAQDNNWKTVVATLHRDHKDWAVAHRQGELQASQLKEPLQGLLGDLKVGGISSVKQQGQTYTILRLNSESSIPAKPLAEVSAEIRKSLAPLQLKKAVKAISQQVLEEAQIQYSKKANP